MLRIQLLVTSALGNAAGLLLTGRAPPKGDYLIKEPKTPVQSSSSQQCFSRSLVAKTWPLLLGEVILDLHLRSTLIFQFSTRNLNTDGGTGLGEEWWPLTVREVLFEPEPSDEVTTDLTSSP